VASNSPRTDGGIYRSIQEHLTGVFCLLSIHSTLNAVTLLIVCCFAHKKICYGPTASLPQDFRPQHLIASHSPNIHPPLSLGMTATAIYATQVSMGGCPSNHGYSPVLPPPTPTSSSLVNTPYHNERPSVKLTIARGKSNIVNSVVVNASGQSLFSISSNSKRTTVVACKNDAEVATVEWNRSSPRMVFRRKKIRCKEWLPLARPDTEYDPLSLTVCCHADSKRDVTRSRILAHGDSQFIWMHKSSTSGYVCICSR
jgi:hypothetical protein